VLWYVEYCYDGGLVDYVKYFNVSKCVDFVYDDVIDFEVEDKDCCLVVEIVM